MSVPAAIATTVTAAALASVTAAEASAKAPAKTATEATTKPTAEATTKPAAFPTAVSATAATAATISTTAASAAAASATTALTAAAGVSATRACRAASTIAACARATVARTRRPVAAAPAGALPTRGVVRAGAVARLKDGGSIVRSGYFTGRYTGGHGARRRPVVLPELRRTKRTADGQRRLGKHNPLGDHIGRSRMRNLGYQQSRAGHNRCTPYDSAVVLIE